MLFRNSFLCGGFIGSIRASFSPIGGFWGKDVLPRVVLRNSAAL